MKRKLLAASACVSLTLLFVVGVQTCFADPSLPTLFSDHMVLQQGREIHVWGKANPGEHVSVSIAGRTETSTADAKGAWRTQLPALAAGGPFTLIIRGKKEIVVRDVMIGEVWIASGQSNMAFSLDGVENAATEVSKADYPQIRLFTFPKRIALTPQEDMRPTHWGVCTPDTAKSFSAVAYFFAREIHRRLQVPVGIVESAWPGTAIEFWMSPETLRSDADFWSIVNESEHVTPEQRSLLQTARHFELEFDDFELLPADGESSPKLLANFDDGSSGLKTGGTFSYSWSDAGDSRFDLAFPGHGEKAYVARVSGDLDGTDEAILAARYQADGIPENLTAYKGIRFWLRGKGSFRFRSKQPSISDYDDYATPVLKATEDWRPITILFRDLHQDGWGVVRDFTPEALTGFSIECLTDLEYTPIPPSSLYEGMITPLQPYQFRGALWYQGESNALKAHQYRKLLPALIQNWRSAFHQNLEFLIVQLPNHGAIPTGPGESAWAELREAELMTVEHTPDTGLAVTIDVGDPKDLHPHRKLEVGQRLALWALGTTYKLPIEYSGPLYQSMQIQGSEVRLQFAHVGTGLVAHGDSGLQGFAIAGADRKFHWAEARIEGDSVVVSTRDVPVPVAVRYAWGDSPVCNLFNQEGLPASPFRTDDWPGITYAH
ncbi:MAG TPA: sialate O-acetylesterase [Dongiaceae bacterium]|nr:sialate O-acetylesterase [Dongiaceae bacterium]